MIVEQIERRTFTIGTADGDDRILRLAQRKSSEGWQLVDVQITIRNNIKIAVFERPLPGTRVKRRTPVGWKA